MTPIEALAILATEDGSPSISRFLIENGRLPFVDDEVKPWAYRGWLIPYLMMCESHPDIPGRYDYVARTLHAGRLLDEPIPQMRFHSEHDAATREGTKMLGDMVKIAEAASGYTRSFELVCDWLAFAVAVTDKPSSLVDKDQERLYRLFDVSRWLLAPTDYLGQYMAENSIGKAAAFFPTPMSVCTMMAMMTFGDGDQRTKKAHDCAVGTGRTLLAASNYCLRLYGQDINYLCVTVCKINFALFAPWHHIPADLFPAEQVPVAMPAENPLSGQGIGPIAAEKNDPGKYSTEIEQPTLF